MAEKMKHTEAGQQIISLLADQKNLVPSLHLNTWLTDEEGISAYWKYFTKFPEELAAVFPGSYVSPATFLRELGINQAIESTEKQILLDHLGSLDNPTMKYDQGNKGNGQVFSLTVLNGLTNNHALAMTEFAYLGFNHSTNRAQYQQHMFESIVPYIVDNRPVNYGIRIFDDCIASGDSIAGYLYKLQQKNNPLLKNGVEITAVTATAQSILFLKNFAEMLGINLTVKVGQLAFGLTEGITEKNGIRKHANYITYPDELLPLLNKETAEQLQKYQIEIGSEKVIQVVGDMGAAEQGIIDKEMCEIRKEIDDEQYCWWNDSREDRHGEHNNKAKLKVPLSINDGRAVIIYLARGGYLPYEWDRKLYPYVDRVNRVIKRASRLWTVELGYGVGLKNDD